MYTRSAKGAWRRFILTRVNGSQQIQIFSKHLLGTYYMLSAMLWLSEFLTIILDSCWPQFTEDKSHMTPDVVSFV